MCRWHTLRSSSADRVGRRTDETSNLRISGRTRFMQKGGSSQSSPLSYKKERETGFEPATPTLARLYSTPEPLAHKEQVMGIEPTYPAWKAGVLPLNYTCRYSFHSNPFSERKANYTIGEGEVSRFFFYQKITRKLLEFTNAFKPKGRSRADRILGLPCCFREE